MRKVIYLFPILFLGIISCEDVIEVPLNKNHIDLFAVEAMITTIDEPYVYLTKAVSVTVDEESPGVSGAVITITDDAQPVNAITLVEDINRKGYYKVPSGIDYYGVTGRKYTVTIQSQGVELVASEYLSPVTPVDSIKIRPYIFGQWQFMAITLFSQEPVGLGNYYKWDVYINDTFLYKTENMAFTSDELVDGNYVSDIEIFVDFYEPGKEEERKLNLNDTVYVKQNSISETTYDFYLQMANQYQGGFLFSVTPSNAKGNFTASDGKFVMGTFTAQDVSISNTIIIDETLESMLDGN